MSLVDSSVLDPPVFEALLVPYRSLSRKGVAAVIALLAVISSTVAIRFWLWGAWPVVLFSLLEVPLVVLMLAINMRRARASEMIMLTAHQLTVVRTDPSGRRKQDLLPVAWLRVDLDSRSEIRISTTRSCETRPS